MPQFNPLVVIYRIRHNIITYVHKDIHQDWNDHSIANLNLSDRHGRELSQTNQIVHDKQNGAFVYDHLNLDIVVFLGPVPPFDDQCEQWNIIEGEDGEVWVIKEINGGAYGCSLSEHVENGNEDANVAAESFLSETVYQIPILFFEGFMFRFSIHFRD